MAVSAALPGLAGCERSDRSEAEDAARAFLAAMEARDDRRACALLSPRLNRALDDSFRTSPRLERPRRLADSTCENSAAHLISPAKAPGHRGALIRRLQVSGDSATATAAAPGQVESEIELERRDGRWRVSNF
jgi:hypothetical protein